MRAGIKTVRLAVVMPTVLAVALATVRSTTAAAQPLSPAAQAGPAPAAALNRAEYEACHARDEAGFRQAIDKVTLAALERGLKGFDYKAAVGDEWRRNQVDQIVTDRVDKAIEEIRSETDFTEQISSLFSKETAQQLATNAAERVYRSDAMKAAIEAIASGVGREIGRRLEHATADAAEPAMRCLQAFLGPRYGTTIAGIVANDATREFGLDAKGAAVVSSVRVLAEGGAGIAGAIILIVRRQLANLASRIGQRLVGAVLSRVVSVIAGGIGVALIAKDLWELRQGALPIIASEMKSPATRDQVQEELGRSIATQISEHLPEISAKTAERVIEIWHEFRRAHSKVLEIAERDEAFRRFVDTVAAHNLARLDEVVALVLASEGEAGLLRRLADGTLHEAVERLPVTALGIARETRSLDAGLRWSALAGDRLPAVLDSEIYRRNGPGEFTKTSLERLLGLDDRVAMARLASLKATVREPLLELPDNALKGLARALTEVELASLSTYMTGLGRAAGQRLLTAIASAPARMQQIASQSVRDAILASPDQAAAVGMMLRGDSVFDFFVFGDDLRLVREGRVSWQLLWARYPAVISTLGVLAMLVLALFWRLLFGRRPRIIVQTPAKR